VPQQNQEPPRDCTFTFGPPLTRSLTTPQVKEADILVAAIGKPEFVQGSWLKPGVVVIDVGTNYIPGALGYCQPQ